MTTFGTRPPNISAFERAALLREQIAEAQRRRMSALSQPDSFGEKSGGRMHAFGAKQDRMAGAEAQGLSQSSIAGAGHDLMHAPDLYVGKSLGDRMKLKQADMERARMHAINPYAGAMSPGEQLKLKQAELERARNEEINRRKLMGAGYESAPANPYAVGASLAEQMKRQKDEAERERAAEVNRQKPMGYAAGVSLAEQMRKKAEMERARNEAFYRRKMMAAAHEAAQTADAKAASMSLSEGSALSYGKFDKKAQTLKPAQPSAQLEANKKKETEPANETGHAMFQPPENKPPPAAAPINLQPETRRFADQEEEAVGQSPNPTITAAMKRPQGRVRMEYAAEKAPGAQGYFIIGEPDAGLMVSGARRVGRDRWYVPPGSVFSVEGPQGKAGVGGYRIKEATYRK